jgi:hypothetical protein
MRTYLPSWPRSPSRDPAAPQRGPPARSPPRVPPFSSPRPSNAPAARLAFPRPAAHQEQWTHAPVDALLSPHPRASSHACNSGHTVFSTVRMHPLLQTARMSSTHSRRVSYGSRFPHDSSVPKRHPRICSFSPLAQSRVPPVRCSGEAAPRPFVYSTAASVCAHQLCGGALPFFPDLALCVAATALPPSRHGRCPRAPLRTWKRARPGGSAWPAWPSRRPTRLRLPAARGRCRPQSAQRVASPPFRPAARGRHARGSLARPRRSLARILHNPGVTSLPSSYVPAAAPAQSARHSGSLAVASRHARSTSSCLATSSSGRPPSLRGEHRLRVGNLVSLCLAF